MTHNQIVSTSAQRPTDSEIDNKAIRLTMVAELSHMDA